jgi:hypothetical protein
MLPGMNDLFMDPAGIVIPDATADSGGFDELRTGTNYGNNPGLLHIIL